MSRWVLALLLCSSISGSLSAQELARRYYRARIPNLCCVSNNPTDLSLDNMTCIKFPGGNDLLIVVIEDKRLTDQVYQELKRYCKEKYSCKSKLSSNFLYRQRGTAMRMYGKIDGQKACIEMGYIKRKKCDYIICSAYYVCDSADYKDLRKEILTSFKPK